MLFRTYVADIQGNTAVVDTLPHKDVHSIDRGGMLLHTKVSDIVDVTDVVKVVGKSTVLVAGGDKQWGDIVGRTAVPVTRCW